jgi:hypothetical protein
MDELERARLTELFYVKLAEYRRDPSAMKLVRKYAKRPTGDELLELNKRHDANGNAWVRLALKYGEQVAGL